MDKEVESSERKACILIRELVLYCIFLTLLCISKSISPSHNKTFLIHVIRPDASSPPYCPLHIIVNIEYEG